MTLKGLCTSADGDGRGHGRRRAAAAALAAPCVSNGWTVTRPLGDGAYTVTASQTDGNGVTGSTGAIPFTVDTVGTDGRHHGTDRAAWRSPRARRQITGTCSTGDGTVSVAITGAAARALDRTVLERHVHGHAEHGAADRCVQRDRDADRRGRQHRHQRGGDLLGRHDRAGDHEQHGVDRQRLEDDGADRHAQPDRRRRRAWRTPTSRPTARRRRSRRPRARRSRWRRPGTYTIKYFSVDALGNAEAVEDRRDADPHRPTAPTGATTFPVNGGAYNAAAWAAGCSTANRICGTAADTDVGDLDRAGAAAAVERLPLLGRLELGDGGRATSRRPAPRAGTSRWRRATSPTA